MVWGILTFCQFNKEPMQAYRDNYKECIDSYRSPISEKIVMKLEFKSHNLIIFFLQLGGCSHKASDEELRSTLGV
jgi:hypothetical protein